MKKIIPFVLFAQHRSFERDGRLPGNQVVHFQEAEESRPDFLLPEYGFFWRSGTVFHFSEVGIPTKSKDSGKDCPE